MPVRLSREGLFMDGLVSTAASIPKTRKVAETGPSRSSLEADPAASLTMPGAIQIERRWNEARVSVDGPVYPVSREKRDNAEHAQERPHAGHSAPEAGSC